MVCIKYAYGVWVSAQVRLARGSVTFWNLICPVLKSFHLLTDVAKFAMPLALIF